MCAACRQYRRTRHHNRLYAQQTPSTTAYALLSAEMDQLLYTIANINCYNAKAHANNIVAAIACVFCHLFVLPHVWYATYVLCHKVGMLRWVVMAPFYIGVLPWYKYIGTALVYLLTVCDNVAILIVFLALVYSLWLHRSFGSNGSTWHAFLLAEFGRRLNRTDPHVKYNHMATSTPRNGHSVRSVSAISV